MGMDDGYIYIYKDAHFHVLRLVLRDQYKSPRIGYLSSPDSSAPDEQPSIHTRLTLASLLAPLYRVTRLPGRGLVGSGYALSTPLGYRQVTELDQWTAAQRRFDPPPL